MTPSGRPALPRTAGERPRGYLCKGSFAVLIYSRCEPPTVAPPPNSLLFAGPLPLSWRMLGEGRRAVLTLFLAPIAAWSHVIFLGSAFTFRPQHLGAEEPTAREQPQRWPLLPLLGWVGTCSPPPRL